MHRNRGLTITEVVIMIAILVVGIALLLPVLGLFGRKRSRPPHYSQLRVIHTGLVLYAQGNNGHYVGIASDGVTIDPAVSLTAQGRVQKLIDENYFTIEYARSYAENQTGTTSFAMLKIDVVQEENTIAKSIRNSEWNDTTNAQSIVTSDRAIPNGKSYKHIKSVHTNPRAGKSDWRGGVAWNDNHVTYETTTILPTKYNTTSHTPDNLFATDNLHHGDDAFMVWTGSDEI